MLVLTLQEFAREEGQSQGLKREMTELKRLRKDLVETVNQKAQSNDRLRRRRVFRNLVDSALDVLEEG